MHRKFFPALIVIASIPAVARPPEDGPIHWQTLEQAESIPSSRPLLVYFGAEWCGPCKMLESTVFNQPEIAKALSKFRAVYIDGDGADAIGLMDRFNVKVFPSLLTMGADGKETGRIVGSAEKREIALFLSDSTRVDEPGAILARIGRGESLGAAQWKALARIDVHTAGTVRDNDQAGQTQRPNLQTGLANAVLALDALEEPVDATTDAWIRVKSLVVDSVSSKPAASIAAHRKLMEKILGDAALRAALESHLLGYSKEIVEYLEPTSGESKRNLARRMLEASEEAYARHDASLAWKMEILTLAIPLLEFGSDNIDADKTRYAERAEEALRRTTEPEPRLAVIANVGQILRRTGRELRAEAAVRETMTMAPDAYWLNASLARSAKQRGDLDAAVVLAERGYRASLSHMSAVAYGPLWVQAIIDRDPTHVEAIAAAANEVLTAASTSKDLFRGWHAESLRLFASTLGAWKLADPTKRSSAIARIEERLDAMCGLVKDKVAEAAACLAAAQALAAPPPAAG